MINNSRGDVHAFFRDALAERISEKESQKMGNLELQDLWSFCLDRFGYEDVDAKFVIELDRDRTALIGFDPYTDVKSGIWCRIQLSYVGDENQIFFTQHSLQQYKSVYRLITRIRNAYMDITDSKIVSRHP